MGIGSATELGTGDVLRTNVCVIGGGAAGLTVARQLVGRNVEVIVLEAGGSKRDPDVERTSFEFDELGEPLRNPEPSRGRSLGGSTTLWFGRMALLDPIDFETRAWVPHSGWPIGSGELAPWLDVAGKLLDVGDIDRLSPDAWQPNETIQTFRDEVSGTAVEVFRWSAAMDMGRHIRPMLEQAPNVTTLLNATVTELVPNESCTAIEAVTAADSTGRRFTVTADVVVLAAGGLENARVLLASTARSPAGIGNDRDLVGRYYMDHPRGEGLAVADLTGCDDAQLARLRFLGERTSSSSGDVQMRVVFSESAQRDEELLNHALHAHFVSGIHSSPGYQAAKRLAQRRRGGQRPESDLSADILKTLWGAPALTRFALAKLTRQVRPTGIVFIDQMEQEPDPSSRLTVDHGRPDRFGLPRLQVDWRIGTSTHRSQQAMHAKVRDVLRRNGIATFRSDVLDHPERTPDWWDMKHPSGTTRMSHAPTSGVVDRNCRVHGVGNLYVGGSSVFPTVGHANPTLTIVALAARLADHLVARFG